MTTFLKHQEEALQFLRNRTAAGLFFEMGCVDGAATVHINRCGKGFSTSLENLFLKFHGYNKACKKGNRRPWDRSKPTFIRSLCGDEFRLNRIENVLNKAVKPVLEIKLSSGKKLKVTPDHEICVGIGKFKEAQNLKAGDLVLTNGSWVDKDGYVRVGGHKGKHHRYTTGGVYEHILVAETMLGRRLKKGEIVHHKNHIKHDNRPENLEVMDRSKHMSHHGSKGGYKRLRFYFVPKIDCVESVKPAGKVNVYDVVCADPHRNFVANGIVVHNCGKTLIQLEHLRRMAEAGKNPFPALIVCPVSAVSVWEREVKKHGFPFKVEKLVGDRKTRLDNLSKPADIYVINFEGLRLIPRQLLEKKFMTVIFDESHRIKERSAQQTRVAQVLSQEIPFRYIMTGTPITKSPEDVWTQFQIIAPGYLGNFYAFRARHVDFKTIKIRAGSSSREIKIPHRFKYLDELNQKIELHAIRRTKDECLDLPEKIYKVVPCPLSSEQKRHYYSLKGSLATLLNDKQFKVNHATTLIQKLQQVCQGFLYGAEGETPTLLSSGKLDTLTDLLRDLESEKIIIFTWYQADQERLSRELQKGRRVLSYSGGVQERQAFEEEFQSSTEPLIFLANIEKAKESITLTAASHVVYFGNSWNYASRRQSEDRAHRIGQKKSVVYYDLIVPGTVDEHVHDTLTHKGEVADKTLGDSMRMAQLILGEDNECEA